MEKSGFSARFAVFFKHWLTVVFPVLLYFISYRLSSWVLNLTAWQIAIDSSMLALITAALLGVAVSPLALFSAPRVHRALSFMSAGAAAVFIIFFGFGAFKAWPKAATINNFNFVTAVTLLSGLGAIAAVYLLLQLKPCNAIRTWIAEGAGRLCKVFLALLGCGAVFSAVSFFFFCLPISAIPELQPVADTGASRAKNVVLITFDALAAKDMSLYGYRLDTTPELNAFAESCTVFDNFYAQANWTLPTITSLLTGTYPSEHRNFNFLYCRHPLAKPQNVLANVLKHKGYKTFALSSNLTFGNPQVTGTTAGFDLIDEKHIMDWPAFAKADPLSAAKLYARNEYTNGLSKFFELLRGFLHPGFPISWPCPIRPVFEYAQTLLGAEPFFLWIHLAPPHEPYLPPAPHKDLYCTTGRFTTVEEQARHAGFYGPDAQKDVDQLRLRYDEFIHYCDDELKRFLDSLQRTTLLDNTLLIISSDHGQSFEDGYCGHGSWFMRNQLIKIPLIIRIPGLPGSRLSVNAEQIDLAPTILDALGFQPPQWMQGESLMPYLLGQKKETDKPKYAMQLVGNSRFAKGISGGSVAAMLGSLKLVYLFGPDGDDAFLYDLASDPEEQNDIAQSRPEDVEKLKALIERDILAPERP